MSANPKVEVRNKPAAARRSEGGFFSRLRAWRDQHAYSLVSSLGRFFQRPFATLLTVGVMAVAIALPLGLGLGLANIETFSGNVRESREVTVFLKPEVDAVAAQRIADELRQRPDVAEVRLKTPAEGLAEFRQMSDLAGALDALQDNPLPTVLIALPKDDGVALASALTQRPEIDLVQHDAVWRERLTAWLGFGARLTGVIAVLLGLGVLLVVGNTIRLEIGARREEIGVLQQLGATDGFVRRPFLYLGAWYGAAAGALALGLLALAGLALQPPLSRLVASYGSQFRLAGPGWPGALAILIAAIIFGWLGAWLASSHHLRQTRPTDL
jgi:cell division transport system permease protein